MELARERHRMQVNSSGSQTTCIYVGHYHACMKRPQRERS